MFRVLAGTGVKDVVANSDYNTVQSFGFVKLRNQSSCVVCRRAQDNGASEDIPLGAIGVECFGFEFGLVCCSRKIDDFS